MGSSDSGYQLGTGIGEDEVARLEAQGAAVAPATRMIFAEAGIRPGMRVLDLGCGPGSVVWLRWSSSRAICTTRRRAARSTRSWSG